MAWVKFVHVAAVILWFGSAAADVILELVLKKTDSRDGQLALIGLHAKIDQLLEAPAIVLALFTGILLLFFGGTQWPGALVVKILCALAAAAANLYCVKVVVERDRWARAAAPDVSLLQSPEGKRLGLRIFATGSGIPFAVVALAIAVVYLR